jgi:hypothetical protein
LAREDGIWRARHGWPQPHEDDHCRAMGVEPATPRLPASAPPEAHAARERAYRLGRTPEPGKRDRSFPPEDEDEAFDGDRERP